MANPEKPQPTEEGKPREFIVDTNTFRVINFKEGVQGTFELTRQGAQALSFDVLVPENAQRLAAENLFSSTTFILLNTGPALKAARAKDGETANLEGVMTENRIRFDRALVLLDGLGYTQEQIREFIREEGKQITQGETHMGIVPPQVKEEMNKLMIRLDRFYKRR